jgi:hypothetical protein
VTLDGLQPIATSSVNNYQDTLPSNGSFYYAVVAGNTITNSTISNCESVFFGSLPSPNFRWEWDMTEVVSTESTSTSYNPAIAVDRTGNIHVAWYDYTSYGGSGSDRDIFYKYWNTATESWTITEVISTVSTGNSYYPAISIDSVGNVHIVWQDYTNYNGAGTDPDIFYRCWNASTGSWKAVEVISTESTSSSSSPDVFIDWIGNIHVVWYDNTNYNGAGTDYDIFYKYKNGTTNSWENTEVVSTESTSHSYIPIVKVDIFGNIHVTWYDQTNYNGSGSDNDIFYKKSNIFSGSWMLTEVISTQSTSASYGPTMITDLLGNIHITWYDYTNYGGSGSDRDIFYTRWNISIGSWSVTEVISTESGGNSYYPDIAVDEFGNLHLVWYDQTDYDGAGTDYDIFYKLWNLTTGTWSVSEIVSTESTSDSSRPEIAVDTFGSIHTVWYDSTNYNGAGTDYDIFYKKSKTFYYPYAPYLNQISPNPDLDGIIDLDWTDVIDATNYYVYRDTSIITSINGLQPIGNVTQSNFQDTLTLNNIYYYVVISANLSGTSPISNCENISILIPLNPPDLQSILPNPIYNGEVNLNWNSILGATSYYIYRNYSYISSVAGLNPIAQVNVTSYQDAIIHYGTLYYVIVAADFATNSSISNCENVTLWIGPTLLQPIIPNSDYDGTIILEWKSIYDATIYYIYKQSSSFSSIEGLTPIATSTIHLYQDELSTHGTYYYVIVAGNVFANSTISNCESVTFEYITNYPEFSRGWDPIEVVSTQSTATSYYPTIAVDGSGNIHVAWYDYTNYGGSGPDIDIFYKRWNVITESWTTTEVVSTVSTSSSYSPALAVDTKGNVHIVWSDSTDYMKCTHCLVRCYRLHECGW